MATLVTQKADRLADAIKAELDIRFAGKAGYTCTKAYATDGSDVTLTLTGTSTLDTSYIQIVQESAPAQGAYDGLGLAQRVYTPHIIRFGYDLTVAWTPMGLTVLAILAQKGASLEVYSDAAISLSILRAADKTAGTYLFTLRDLQWGIMSQQ
jgi:hypothetical protein